MADLYELQQAMRAMRQSALQRGALAILDLGSTKIGCLILRFDGLDPSLASDQVGSLAGQSSFQVVGSAITRSRGIEFGEISSMQEAERAIRTVLQSAQKMANLRVDHLIACFSGGGPRSYGLNGVVKIENQIVQDLHKIQIYKNRLNKELDVISKMGFSGYFLIVSDFVKWSKDNNIPVGPGRGSGAGSIAVSYTHLRAHET